jgi:hypothetical protein
MSEAAQKLSAAGFPAKTHEVLKQAELVAEKIPTADMQMQAIQKVRSLMGKLPKE